MTTFKSAVQKSELKGKTSTENGDVTYKSSNDIVLDFFYKIGSSRGLNSTESYHLFLKAYTDNPDLAFRALLWLRDVREGAGERQLFRDIMSNLALHYPMVAKQLVHKIPELGRWDDVLVLVGTTLETEALMLIKQALLDGNGLCAKWMPRTKNKAKKIRKYQESNPDVAKKIREEQQKHNSFVHNLANKLAYSMNEYRKLVSSLSNTVEQQMSSKEWEDINYNQVPSRASKIYSKAFLRNDESRYQQYLNDLTLGTEGVKINANAIFPHDVLGEMFSNYNDVIQVDSQQTQRIEAQWKALPNYLTSDAKILPVVDVSGSMFTDYFGGVKPIEVAISLGLYLSEKQSGPFQNLVMTFDSNPQLIEMKGDSITQKVHQLARIPWGQSTDLDKMYTELLTFSLKNKIKQSEMPEYIFIASDMQFNGCMKNADVVVYKRMKAAFKDHGYDLPTIIFWNVSTKGGVPLKSDTPNTALISGFSPSILKSILNDPSDITPMGVMLNILNKERYNYEAYV